MINSGVEKKIKLIWDFRGPTAAHVARHHEKHLKEYITAELLQLQITGHADLSNAHSIAFMVVFESEMIPVRDRLRPHRGELYTEMLMAVTSLSIRTARKRRFHHICCTIAGLLSGLIALSCAGTAIQKDPLLSALASDRAEIRRVMDNPDAFEIQIRYTRVNRKSDSLVFEDFDFQVNDSNYFYPASTVKLPVAVLALEKLNTTPEINLKTRFYVEGDTVETGFEDDIIAIFAVSDNDAYNRLFEFLGQDRINNRLKSLRTGPVRISHRLSVQNADEVTTKPIVVYLNDSTTTIIESTVNSPPKPLELPGIEKGIGYYEEDSLINEPFNFSLKNYYPLKTQHEVLKRIIFPRYFPADQRFDLSNEHRELLLKAMSLTPRHWGYDEAEYYDSYGKFFIYGDRTDYIPESVKIFNKVGYAYGTLTDCAYIRDEINQLEFMISATILVNKNGIFNDDDYEYEEVGIPFLAGLGRELYQYEMEQKK